VSGFVVEYGARSVALAVTATVNWLIVEDVGETDWRANDGEQLAQLSR
jgi:hypothetical protein